MHVGVLLDATTIVHAAGEVRVDALVPEGIQRDDQVGMPFTASAGGASRLSPTLRG